MSRLFHAKLVLHCKWLSYARLQTKCMCVFTRLCATPASFYLTQKVLHFFITTFLQYYNSTYSYRNNFARTVTRKLPFLANSTYDRRNRSLRTLKCRKSRVFKIPNKLHGFWLFDSICTMEIHFV